MLLLLLGLPLGRSLVTRHSVRPDLAPVLRLKGGATFNQWLRLFRVVVKGAKGGARNAQRVPAANLLLSMLQNFGVEADRFGTSSGTLTGLERKS